MLLLGELEELAVRAVGGPEGVGGHGVGLVVLLVCEKLLGAALLEFGVGSPAILRQLHELLGDVHLTHVVAADLRDNLARLVLEADLIEVLCMRQTGST